MKLRRVYHPVAHWEECDYNMWGECVDRAGTLAKAIKFTGDHELYGSYMIRVTKEWPISCENALTDLNLNRKAWLGHAACAMYARIPEDVTREAWSQLSDEQQLLANYQAREAISAWELRYRKDIELCGGLGETLLFDWHPRRSAEKAARNRSRA